MIADTTHAGEVYINKKGLTNILSISQMEKVARSHTMMKRKFFSQMFLQQNQFLSAKTSIELYAYNLFEEVNNYQFITPIEENRKF